MIKAALKIIGLHKVKWAVQSKLQSLMLSGKSPEDIFTTIYKKNSWNGAESISGQGSDLTETHILLDKLPDLLRRYDIKTIIDLPCGDFHWLRHLHYSFDHYTGVDIVSDIITSNNKKFGRENRVFEKKNCLEDNIGEADLLFCRDLLIHFSEDDIFKFFNNICRSNIKYLLTTHFIEEQNSDIATGQWRPINLTAAPYNLPAPLDFILEETKMFNGRYGKIKAMALWRMADIKNVIN